MTTEDEVHNQTARMVADPDFIKPSEAYTLTPMTLEYQKLGQQIIFPRGLLDLDFQVTEQHSDLFLRDELVARLTAYVLADENEKEHVKVVTWNGKVKPWWIPQRLWNRVPTEPREVRIVLKGRNFYPNPPPESAVGRGVRKHGFEYYVQPANIAKVLDGRQDHNRPVG